VSKFEQPETQF